MPHQRLKELKIKQGNAAKDSTGKGITPYQEKVLKNQETRLTLERQRLQQAADSQDKKLPEYIDKYTSGLLKDAEVKLPANDKAELNGFVEQLMTDKENPMTVNEAFNHAYQYIEARREKIDTVQITPKPTAWIGKPNPNEVLQSADKAFQELKSLHYEDGIDSQKDLREIARRGG